MRFCLFSTQHNWGGGEELMHTLAQQLQKAGHETCWIVRGASPVQDKLSSAQILAKLHRRGLNLRDFASVPRLVRTYAPDVVIANDTHSVMLAAAAAFFCRSPKPTRLAYKHTVFPLRSPLKYRWLTDKLICVSHAAKDVVVKGGLEGRHTAVVHGGCDLINGTPTSASNQLRVQLANEFNLPPSSPFLLSVGSLLEVKGHHILIDALHAYKQQYASCPNLLIAGDGPERDRLTNKIADLGLQDHIALIGHRNDVTDLFWACDLLVHPSLAEGLSLVLIQAQMVACPIVATPVGGAAEVLGVDASGSTEACTSWLAQPNNPHSLMEQIHSALGELSQPQKLHEKLDKRAQVMQKQFSSTSSARRLLEIIQTIRSADQG